MAVGAALRVGYRQTEIQQDQVKLGLLKRRLRAIDAVELQLSNSLKDPNHDFDYSALNDALLTIECLFDPDYREQADTLISSVESVASKRRDLMTNASGAQISVEARELNATVRNSLTTESNNLRGTLRLFVTELKNRTRVDR